MANVLSQSEVESLLSALDPTINNEAPAPPAGHGTTLHEFNSQVSVYDFKRPERVSKEQMRAFQALHDGFSREFGASLSAMLRTIVECKLISVDQLTYSEFVFSLENPTCFNLLDSEGLDGKLILDISPSIIFPVIDRLLGGGKDTQQRFPGRPLTEIELNLVSRITDQAIHCLHSVWKNVCDLKLKVSQVESNPQLVQIVPPNEVVVLISFEITMGDMRGIMNLCIPFNSIEPLAGQLSSNTWQAYTRRSASPEQKLNLQAGVGKAKVQMVVNLATSSLTGDELMGLEVGDIIMTEKEQTEPFEVLIEGQTLFEAFPGLYRGHKAIRVDHVVQNRKEMIQQQLTSQDAVTTEPEAEKPS